MVIVFLRRHCWVGDWSVLFLASAVSTVVIHRRDTEKERTPGESGIYMSKSGVGDGKRGQPSEARETVRERKSE